MQHSINRMSCRKSGACASRGRQQVCMICRMLSSQGNDIKSSFQANLCCSAALD